MGGKLALGVLAIVLTTGEAVANPVKLLCTFFSTDEDHSRITSVVSFDEDTQSVELSNGYKTRARISEAIVTFEIPIGNGQRSTTEINRVSGAATIKGTSGRDLYAGSCALFEPGTRKF